MNTPEPYYFARELAEMYQLSEGDIRAAMCCSVSSPFHLPNIALGTSKRPRRKATRRDFEAWQDRMKAMPAHA